MSNGAFLQSEAFAFKQSACRARRTRSGQFVFQFLAARLFERNTDGGPWGEKGGQDLAPVWPDPAEVSFIAPAPVPGKGGTIESWGVSSVDFTEPNQFLLFRASSQVLDPAVKNGFGWKSGGHTYTILLAYRQHWNYNPFVSAVDGRLFPGGNYSDIQDRFKVFPGASGVATYHTIDNSAYPYEMFNGFLSPVSIPLWTKITRKDATDPVVEFTPKPSVATQLELQNPLVQTVYGTIELCLFWFEREPADLPAFPFLLDPSTL